MPPVGFKPTISADERPQTYALDRTATGTGSTYMQKHKLTVQRMFAIQREEVTQRV